MEEKIRLLLAKLAKVEQILGESEVYQDQTRFRQLTQEHSYLSEIRRFWEELQRLEKEEKEARQLLKEDKDPTLREMVQKELETLEESKQNILTRLQSRLIPPDPRDDLNVIVELRAGTGGEEAALFVADCARMYKLYADQRGWQYELLSCTPSDMGGFKEYVMVLSGKEVYRYMKFEGGTHRVQRVPETEAQGRVHTSAITVAVLTEPKEQEDIQLDEKDLRIDTYRSSGAGGQHVNTTDSAVRITHLPTGIVVHCQEERSQHKNKEKALRFLKAKIREVEEQKRAKTMASDRLQQVGSGDRSERIRTYNFPQNRVTDHRINLTRYHLDRIMIGDLEEFSLALLTHFKQKELQAPYEAR